MAALYRALAQLNTVYSYSGAKLLSGYAAALEHRVWIDNEQFAVGRISLGSETSLANLNDENSRITTTVDVQFHYSVVVTV